MTTIETRDLACGYGNKPVIGAVSVGFDGGFTAILGANGAGKSTLLKTLATELPARGGDILHDGERLHSRNLRGYRSAIGWVPQREPFDDTRTPAEFVAMVGWLRGLGWRRAHAAAREVLADVGLAERADDRIASLSGGMRRRVSIAAGLVNDPAVLLLDEPTAGLDPAQRASILTLVHKAGATGRTVVMSTHIASDVTDCDRVLILARGGIAADATPAELTATHGGIDEAFIAVAGEPS